MIAANLQLERYFVEELLFQVRSTKKKFESSPDPLGRDLNTEVAIGENTSEPLKKLCRLTVELTEKKKKSFPYDFRVVLVGFFNVDEECPDELRERLLHVTGPSLLFTAARELLLLVSSRSGVGPVMLPTVVFPGVESKTRRRPRPDLLP